jgi:hypothetical protein
VRFNVKALSLKQRTGRFQLNQIPLIVKKNLRGRGACLSVSVSKVNTTVSHVRPFSRICIERADYSGAAGQWSGAFQINQHVIARDI